MPSRPTHGATTLQHALRVRDVLVTERAGERFFAALYAMHRRMVTALEGRGSRHERETGIQVSVLLAVVWALSR
ncbi:MAG: hypothetical protein WD934_07215 [Gemmatimonadales bacterium]